MVSTQSEGVTVVGLLCWCEILQRHFVLWLQLFGSLLIESMSQIHTLVSSLLTTSVKLTDNSLVNKSDI